MESTLRIATWNTRGMTAAIPYLKHMLENNDIVMINEHWLHANRVNKLSDLTDNFNVFARSSRNASAEEYGITRGQGGVGIFWRKSLFGTSPVTDIVHDRFCAIRLETRDGCIIYFFAVYLPDTSSKDAFNEILDELSSAIDSIEEGALVILGGDFNGDTGNYLSDRSKKPPNLQGTAICSFIDRYNFIPTNVMSYASGPLETYVGPVGSSTIDYIMVPHSLQKEVVYCRVLDDEPHNTSDHRPIELGLRLENLMARTFEVNTLKKIKWSKTSPESIAELYTDPVNQKLSGLIDRINIGFGSCNEIDEVFEHITSVLIKTDENMPRSKYKSNVKPYWDEQLTLLKREKIFYYNRWKEQGRPRTTTDESYVQYKESKKKFMRHLRYLSKQYEQQEIAEVIKSTEVDYKFFWKALKKTRNNKMAAVFSIKNKEGLVKHDIEGVLQVWFEHFNELSTPKSKPEFDEVHYVATNAWVEDKTTLNDIDIFLEEEFSLQEVENAILKLKKSKSPGYDSVCAEHIQYGGYNLSYILCSLFNSCIQKEYVPICLRRGIQIPLFKGKNACSLDPNNYRGITLLSSFNKLFEILLWSRLETWWYDNHIISDSQGACKKKQSCIHSAMILQEAVAASMEANGKCFVAYFDVAKAFDSVWINGLFRQLYDLGITGRIWRILRKAYVGFKSRVRIHSKSSDWYDLDCGIHQGGFLSSLKYVAFINSLLEELKNSALCISINGIKCSPIGYADDMAAACSTKNRLDNVITLVCNHGNRWRYEYNARKSAVLVYGEDKRMHDRNSVYRIFNLGGKRIPEKEHYDHVGIKACIYENDSTLVNEKVSKGRKTLNAATGIGVRRNGLCMAICNLIFWMVVVPITTYGSEIWVMSQKDIDNLETFQRYAGRRFQRFTTSSPNMSSYYGLGWIGIITFICIKKLMFVQTILQMDEDNYIRKIFKERALTFNDNIRRGVNNEFRSPIFDMLKVSINFGVYEQIMRQLFMQNMVGKMEWKKCIWKKAWELEDSFWDRQIFLQKKCQFLVKTVQHPRYLTWWYLSDLYPNLMYQCEDMAKLVCNASKLKADDVNFRHSTYYMRTCIECNMSVIENVEHIVMQCPALDQSRRNMYDEILELPNDLGTRLLEDPSQVMLLLMGKSDNRFDIEHLILLWSISARHISKMYRQVVKNRLEMTG